jgi:hypothetical protein
VRAFDLGKLPPTIVTDWAAPLLDGDLPLDCSIDVAPLDLACVRSRPTGLPCSRAVDSRQRSRCEHIDTDQLFTANVITYV